MEKPSFRVQIGSDTAASTTAMIGKARTALRGSRIYVFWTNYLNEFGWRLAFNVIEPDHRMLELIATIKTMLESYIKKGTSDPKDISCWGM